MADAEKNPPTVFDRVIEVKDPSGFDVDFDLVMKELKKVAQEFYQMEKGIRYRVPPLIPREHRQSVLENPEDSPAS